MAPGTFDRICVTRRATHAVCVVMCAASLACRDAPAAPMTSQPPESVAARILPGETWAYSELAPTLSDATAHGINDSSIVVGAGTTALGTAVAWRWRNGSFSTLKMPAGSSGAAAYDVNLAGQIVGRVTVGATTFAFVRSPQGGTVTLLPTLPGGDDVYTAYGINDAGNVVGSSQPSGRAVLWTLSHGVWQATDLGLPSGMDLATAYDINNAGWIVGIATVSGQYMRGFVKEPGQPMEEIGTLDPPNGSSSAMAINQLNEVLGTSDVPNELDHYIGWTVGGGMESLFTGVHVNAIGGLNDQSRIAGSTWYFPPVGASQTRAFTFKNGVYALLPGPGNMISGAGRDVSSCGLIVGNVRSTGGNNRAALWRHLLGGLPFCD